eukprot:GHVS01095763.1.p1 GENE.GHVS01095763.1~~GHVS01095763.1.p1  ORF type:complete len:1115 (+),score=197.80 GHVS01095763.1:42-3347(+)
MYGSSYKFSNLLGSVYHGGPILFSGDALLSGSGNRLSWCDLKDSRNVCLPLEAKRNIEHILINPTKPTLALVIDEGGSCSITNLRSGVVLERLQLKSFSTVPTFHNKRGNKNFKADNVNAVAAVASSPDGNVFAVAIQKKIQIWKWPVDDQWHLQQLVVLSGHLEKVESLDFSPNGRYLLSGSRDATARVHSAGAFIPGFTPVVLADHRTRLRGAYFSSSDIIVSVSVDGAIICWKWNSKNNNASNTPTHSSSFSTSPGTDSSSSSDEEVSESLKDKRRRHKAGEARVVIRGVRDEERMERKKGLYAEWVAEQGNEVGGCDFVDGKWTIQQKAFWNLTGGAKVTCSRFHRGRNLLVLCSSSGVFSLYECPTLSTLYTLSIGTAAVVGGQLSSEIAQVDINGDGSWIAIGTRDTGTLLVWEWQSETYILRQQGHHFGVQCLAFSPAGSAAVLSIGSHVDKEAPAAVGHSSSCSVGLSRSGLVATGGVDGKVKLWDTHTGFCFITFTQHTAACMDVVFTPQANAVLTASLDGSVRAFDLLRYRNFRTFAAVDGCAVQFVCVAVDGAGELVTAGAQAAEDYHVYVWSIQTGRLVERLSGHTGPVVGLAFHPHPNFPGVLATASWDQSIRVWDLYGRVDSCGGNRLDHSTSVLAMAFDPRGNGRIAAATMAGKITFWNFDLQQVVGTVDGLRDIQTRRRFGDKFAANNSRGKSNKQLSDELGPNSGVNQNQHFTSIGYSATGDWILACSKQSPRVCVYDTNLFVLVQAVQLTRNLSLDGLLMQLSSRYMTESGLGMDQLDLSDSEEEDTFGLERSKKRIRQDNALPGVSTGESRMQKHGKQFDVWKIRFSPDGRQWGVATSHGLFLYSLDSSGASRSSGDCRRLLGNLVGRSTPQFAPQWLTKFVNLPNIQRALDHKQHAKAFILSLALNHLPALSLSYHSVPLNNIQLVVQSIAPPLLPGLLNLLRMLMSPNAIQPPPKSLTGRGEKGEGCGRTSSVLTWRDGGAMSSPHLEVHMRWLQALFDVHMDSFQGEEMVALSGAGGGTTRQSPTIEGNACMGMSRMDVRSVLLMLLRQLQEVHSQLGRLYTKNLYTLTYLQHLQTLNT